LNIKLTEKMIKDMCGTVSFKRGDSFYQAKKVTLKSFGPNRCEATVRGTEDILVTIEEDEKGKIRSECSCPTLASFQKDCQHIAAVLIAIHRHQQKGTTLESDTNPLLTEGFLNLFNDQSVPLSGRMNHFETRKEIEIVFICKPVTISNKNQMLSIEMKIGNTEVQQIRDFLGNVKRGIPTMLSASFTYDPGIYCFKKETDLVVRELVRVIEDEKVYRDFYSDHSNPMQLIIPPSAWDRLFPLMKDASFVKLEYWGNTFNDLTILTDLGIRRISRNPVARTCDCT
jgi:hypothetical protein